MGELRVQAASSGPWTGTWTPLLGYWEDGQVRPADPEGVMTGTEARKKNLGGELLCYVW